MPEAFTTAFTFVWDQFGNCIDLITGKPILLIGFGVGVAGAILSQGKRFLRFGRRH